MPARVTRMGLQIDFRTGEREALAETFARRHWIRLAGFLDPPILDYIRQEVPGAQFARHVHRGVSPPSIDLVMRPNTIWALLEAVVNDAALFTLVRDLTACGPIGCFSGFVYRLTPGEEHVHEWHDDLARGDRLVAMSVNLGEGAFEGGVLQLRDRQSGRVLEEVANRTAGDAVLFRLAPHLQHRVTSVRQAPRTVFSGWFRSGQSFKQWLTHLYSAAGEVPESARRA